MTWLEGIVIAGHGVASGRAADTPYPAGSIALQQPHFLQAGIDLSAYFAGTLNVDLALHKSQPKPRPRHIVFDGKLQWHGDITERFVLARIACRVAGHTYEGLWYYPDPETKPAHFQRDAVVELLLPYIDGIATGDAVSVQI